MESCPHSLSSYCLRLPLFRSQALTARTEWMTGVLVLLWGSEVHLALCLGLFCDFNVNLWVRRRRWINCPSMSGMVSSLPFTVSISLSLSTPHVIYCFESQGRRRKNRGTIWGRGGKEKLFCGLIGMSVGRLGTRLILGDASIYCRLSGILWYWFVLVHIRSCS